MFRRKARRRPSGTAPRVVVVGMGFAGMAAVSRLSRAGMHITLVDRNIYSTFQPLLYQVATGGLNPSDVAYPIRGFAHRYGARFVHADLADIDEQAQKVTLGSGDKLGYDYLVLGTGVAASYYGITGAEENSLGLYTRRDAVALRDHVLAWLERLSSNELSGEWAVTVVGGGATGVELAGTLAELRNIALPTAYPDIDRSRMHIRLIEQAPVLLGPFRPSLQEYARRQLLARAVDVRLNATIREVTRDHVVLADGEHVPSDITVWAAGISARDSAGGWGLPQGQGGRILVDPDLRVSGHGRIFAVGDVALIEGNPLPQLAQGALQTGRHAAEQIVRLSSGRPTVPFKYHDKGIMATIGRHSAVAQLPLGVRFRGWLAWMAWLGLHLVTLLGNRNRISALINLSYRYLSWGRGGALLVDSDPPPGGAEQSSGATEQSSGEPAA